ncbi:MAG: tetratricopeptide repeat protein [Candidatus Thermoplasmatota archaeon]|nr:tetratricopeptide repeat protein [Candidatus Thermoplasmatota archaeon]
MLAIKFVDREAQVEELIKCFEKSARGLGNTVFITGEAGIGKTALVEQLKEVAIRKGALFLAAECRAPVLTPYEPFTEAFSNIIESLLPTEEVTCIEEVFLINTAGLLLAHVSKKEALIDREVVGGMLTAIQDFVAQSFREKAKGLEKLEYGKTAILLEHGANVFIACVVAGKELPAIRNDMISALRNIETQYGKILADWDGNVSKIKGIEANVKELIEKRYVPEFKDPGIIESKKLEIFETVLRTCLNLAQKQPVIIFLDRLELADNASLELLHYLARNIAHANVMLCCAYRSEELERNSQLVNTVHLIKKDTSAIELALDHFDYNNLSKLVATIFPKNNFPQEFMEVVGEKAGGNPFIIQEILKALVADGIIYKEEATWKLKDITALELPKTIREAVFYRVSSLDEESKEVLRYSSVAGTEFCFSILQKALGYDEEKLADILEKILNSGLLKEENEWLKFDHGVTQESIYKGIPKFKRAIIHKKLGFAAEELYSKELDRVAPMLAHHFSEGKVHDKAYFYGLNAGDKARKLLSLVESIKYYELALRALKNLPDKKSEPLTLLNKLCEVSIIAGRWEEALRYANELSSLCVELGEHNLRASSYMKIAEIYSNRSQWDEAFEAYKLSLDIFEKLKDLQGLAEAQRGLGLVYRRKGDYEKAVEHYKNSIELAKVLGAKSFVASVYVDLGLVYKVQGELELAAKYTKESLETLDKLNELYELARTYNNLGTIYYEQENIDSALQCYEKCAEISKKIGFMRPYAYGLSNAAELYAKSNPEKAMKYCSEAMEIFEKLGEKYMIAQTYVHYGNIYKIKKERGKAQEHFERSLKLFEELKAPFDLGVACYEYALMYKEEKEFAKAEDYLRKALIHFEEVGAKKYIKRVRKELEELKP